MKESEEPDGRARGVRAFIHRYVPAKYVHAAEALSHWLYLVGVFIWAHDPYAYIAGGCAALVLLVVVAGYSEEV